MPAQPPEPPGRGGKRKQDRWPAKLKDAARQIPRRVHSPHTRGAARDSSTAHPRWFQPDSGRSGQSAKLIHRRRRVLQSSQHEHGLLAVPIEVFEERERLLLEPDTALLVPVDDVERVLAPVGLDVVFAQGGREDLVARIFETDAEGFEDFNGGRRVGWGGCG